MQMLIRYFTPFALLLVLTAIKFGEPEPRDQKFALAILAASIVVNWWLSANTYRFIRWTREMRLLQIWMNYIWAVPLFYLLVPYWAPMWLLFAMAPITAALYMSLWPTLATAAACAGSMLGIYYFRNPLEGAALAMACVHAAFIVILSLFVHKLAQNELRMRDVGRA